MRDQVDTSALIWGVAIGVLGGALLMLFRVPRSGAATRRQISQAGQDLYDQIEEAITPTDPVAESLAAGKAAARRRRSELGLD